jgi:GalNAc-alpha-(1->4)-GalNAc-alpha-(1->3)-diNAcBac-PP-undecaprenol alpha-1,4-N-acetyl-D-galactosaminyltransferase
MLDPEITKDWTLHFLGDGPNREALEYKVEKLKLSNQIFFIGKVKNVAKYYNSSSIFAFCSHSEGFPNALAEAMSYGCACISFDCISGPSDLIDDGINGFLIDIKNNKSYVDKLHNLITDYSLREKFSENSLKKVKLFDRNKITKDLFNIISNEDFN